MEKEHQDITVGPFRLEFWFAGGPIYFRQEGSTIYCAVKKLTDMILIVRKQEAGGDDYQLMSPIKSRDGEKNPRIRDGKGMGATSLKRRFHQTTILDFKAVPYSPADADDSVIRFFPKKETVKFDIHVEVI